jgi:hypothetical protein
MAISRYPKALWRRLRPVARQLLKPTADMLVEKQLDKIGMVEKATQLLLALQYAELQRRREPLPSFEAASFRAYSQNGEDGVLHLVFSLIKTTNKRCVEICAGDGIECNTANLIINDNWNGLLVDGSDQNVRRGQEFYSTLRETRFWPPKFVQGWITTDSVNSVIRENGFQGEIDLLSLDIDGNDYWIWEAIDSIEPRVVILEYQKAWGTESVTQRYDPNYVWPGLEEMVGARGLAGASLPAFVKLGRKKGYRLVGSHFCLNAVFLRNGVGEELFPEVSAAEILADPRAQPAIAQRQQWERQGLLENWVRV